MSEGVAAHIREKFPKLPHFPLEWEDFTELTEVVTQYECFIREAYQFRDEVLAVQEGGDSMNDEVTIFDKQAFWKDLDKAKFTPKQLDAIKYITDIVEDLIGAIGENINQIDKNARLFRGHQHLNGKVVKEV